MKTKAEQVREVFHHIATDPKCCETYSLKDREMCWRMARHADDATLLKLGALLK